MMSASTLPMRTKLPVTCEVKSPNKANETHGVDVAGDESEPDLERGRAPGCGVGSLHDELLVLPSGQRTSRWFGQRCARTSDRPPCSHHRQQPASV